jgi:hypothetical protein
MLLVLVALLLLLRDSVGASAEPAAPVRPVRPYELPCGLCAARAAAAAAAGCVLLLTGPEPCTSLPRQRAPRVATCSSQTHSKVCM